jgi:putative hemolysin
MSRSDGSSGVVIPTAGSSEPRLSVAVAHSASDIEDAQRLRYKVFAQEMGAKVGDGTTGIDADDFDPYCDHLIVRDLDTLRVVGTYRILAPHRARELGRLYSEGEFDLSRLHHIAPTMVEVGRSCVHRDYRSGSTILLLWAGMAHYMKAGGYNHLIGCASVSLADGGHTAARVRLDLQKYLTDPEYRVFPHLPFPYERIEAATSSEMPPLLKGYLRIGARICGEPAWDPDFNTADFLVWLSLSNLHPRYARHFELLAAQGDAAERASTLN